MQYRVFLPFPVLFLLFSLAVSGASADTTGSLAVSVVDSGGNPVPDARVSIVELGESAYVDKSGSALFDEIAPGYYHIEATSDRFGKIVSEITLAPGESARRTLELGRSVHSEKIVVTASAGGRGSGEVVVPVQVLDAHELRQRMQPTLGETLAQEAGVRSTFFGNGASRPVIRGQGGPRVRILEEGLGVGDASTTSPDHAVSTDPAGAEAVEIVRGPAALIYDSSAIGGLVNVLDNRIPDHAPRKPLVGSVDLRMGSAAEERTGSLDLNGGGERLAWHVDATSRNFEDYDIPGPAVVRDPDSASGSLPNSGVESSTLTAGGSLLFDRGYVGISARTFESEYGIQEVELEPVGLPPGMEEEGGVLIDMRQRRLDLRGGVDLGDGFADKLTFGIGVTDYEHTEFEGGEAGTRFFNESREARFQLDHGQTGRRPGTIGLQYRNREARAAGEEAFVPENDVDALALFAFQELRSGPLRFELSGRFETIDNGVGPIAPEIAARIATNDNCVSPTDADFDNLSASAGVVWLSGEDYAVGATLSRAIRSPVGEELYSCGPHLATQSFEVGNSNLSEETGLALDVSLRKRSGRLSGEVNFFVNRYDDYIYEVFTGRILTEEGESFDPILTPDPEFVLPEFQFRQADAEFYGAELRLVVDLKSDEVHHLGLELLGDFVRAELSDSGEYLPRIPAARYGAGLHYRGEKWYASAAVRHTQAQDRLSPSEMLTSPDVEGLELIGGPTDAYTRVDASVGYRVVHRKVLHDISLRGVNVTDELIREHTSRLKNVAPLPGVDVGASYRLVF